MYIRGVLLTAVVLAQHPPGAVAQAQLSSPSPSLATREAVGAAALILAAAFFADQGVRIEVLEHRSGATRAAAQFGNAFGDPRYVLPALGAGFVVGQALGSPEVSRAAQRAGEAVIVASGVTAALKLAVGRRRPSGDGDAGIFRPFSGWSSFPSGHTALAFALATALAAERRDGWSDAALYGAAGATAFARLNDDRHWLTDVLAGALVGHLTARLLLHRHSRVSLGPTGPAVSIAF